MTTTDALEKVRGFVTDLIEEAQDDCYEDYDINTGKVEGRVNWTVEQMKKTIEQSDLTVCRALVVLYKLQEQDEKDSKATSHKNGVGFNKMDAEFCSSLAKQCIKKWDASGNADDIVLTPKQIQYGREKIMKYAKQLCEVANGKLSTL